MEAVSPDDGIILSSCMLAARAGNAGMSVVGWLGEFHAELMVKLITQ